MMVLFMVLGRFAADRAYRVRRGELRTAVLAMSRTEQRSASGRAGFIKIDVIDPRREVAHARMGVQRKTRGTRENGVEIGLSIPHTGKLASSDFVREFCVAAEEAGFHGLGRSTTW